MITVARDYAIDAEVQTLLGISSVRQDSCYSVAPYRKILAGKMNDCVGFAQIYEVPMNSALDLLHWHLSK